MDIFSSGALLLNGLASQTHAQLRVCVKVVVADVVRAAQAPEDRAFICAAMVEEESSGREGNGKHVDFIIGEESERVGFKDRIFGAISRVEESIRQSLARLLDQQVVSHHHRERIASSEAARLYSTPGRRKKINSRL